MVLTVLVSINDASSALHFRSALRHTTDSLLCYLFSYAQYHDFSPQHLWVFCNLHLYGDCGGPPSISERALLYFPRSIAFRTHYVIDFYCPFGPPPILWVWLATPYSLYHRRLFIVICIASAYSILPSIAGGLVFSFTVTLLRELHWP